MISRELSDELDDLIQSNLAAEMGFTNKSQIIAAGIREIVSNYGKKYRLVQKRRKEEDSYDITIIGQFPKCNFCDKFNCIHIDRFLKDKELIKSLKKEGITPRKFSLPREIEIGKKHEVLDSITSRKK